MLSWLIEVYVERIIFAVIAELIFGLLWHNDQTTIAEILLGDNLDVVEALSHAENLKSGSINFK